VPTFRDHAESGELGKLLSTFAVVQASVTTSDFVVEAAKAAACADEDETVVEKFDLEALLAHLLSPFR